MRTQTSRYSSPRLASSWSMLFMAAWLLKSHLTGNMLVTPHCRVQGFVRLTANAERRAYGSTPCL